MQAFFLVVVSSSSAAPCSPSHQVQHKTGGSPGEWEPCISSGGPMSYHRDSWEIFGGWRDDSSTWPCLWFT